jgi:hypothetical protein
MFSPLSKISAVCMVAIALGLMANGARAESYPSDAPSAGVSEAKAKPRPVRVMPKLLVVHPRVVDTSTSRKRGK